MQKHLLGWMDVKPTPEMFKEHNCPFCGSPVTDNASDKYLEILLERKKEDQFLGRCAECQIWFVSTVFEDKLTPEDVKKLKDKWLKNPNIGGPGSLPGT
jgi:hypothetical protein